MRLSVWIACAIVCVMLAASSTAAASSSMSLSTVQRDPNVAADCEGCKAIVRTAMEVAGNTTEMAEVIQVLINDCHSLHLNESAQKLCDTIVTTLVNLLPKVKKELDGLAWPIPEGICSVFLSECSMPCCDAGTPYLPEQIHIALTTRPSEMSVSWVTLRAASQPRVQWGLNGGPLTDSAPAAVSTYTVGGWIGTVYNAVMTGLKPWSRYWYRIGSDSGWSRQIVFSTLADYSAYRCNNTSSIDYPSLRFAVVGDMAYDNYSDATVAHLQSQVDAGVLDVILHAGDISYADGYQPHWDLFMRKIDPIASRVPYMVVPGNHEFWFNFTAYKSRWFMPGAQSGSVDPSMFYSLNIGPIHIQGIDTETWLDTADINPLQKRWIINDFKDAAARKNQQPWLVTMGHRPLYCSNKDKTGCQLYTSILQSIIEDTFVQYKVDLVIQAHMHDYERSWPTYKGLATSNNYTDAKSPVYVVNGAAGNRERLSSDFVVPAPNWSAARAHEYGYAELIWTPVDNTPGKLTWQFFADDGDVLHDAFVLTKNQC